MTHADAGFDQVAGSGALRDQAWRDHASCTAAIAPSSDPRAVLVGLPHARKPNRTIADQEIR